MIKIKCECKNVTIGGYENQTTVERPDHMKKNTDNPLCIDTCILPEIEYLWSKGITTTGCCCAHHVNIPFIGVIDEDIQKMKDLGYIIQTNYLDVSREDSFYPKSIEIEPKGVENYTNHALKVMMT